MKPEVEMYFTDPAVLSKKYHSQLSQVSGKFLVFLLNPPKLLPKVLHNHVPKLFCDWTTGYWSCHP